ncbi:energy-coupling factor transporter transmembrane component T [Corynebacterium caspium]|uniref:energy-coupling factor transporter transmembrane component T n=1 Tax=Corynebacterium caspium TaxID=234828 RepID=UPI00035C98EA|nr:energy-coupling factor transporter transmembrane component T [Corynebacterium caspium]WKD59524.1 Putative HMP/thiamine permease protein YkoC [Corynebacterium caspium DSM 44850]
MMLNPVARVLGVFLVTAPLLLSVDIISAGVSLFLSILVSLAVRIPWQRWRSLFPLGLAAPIAGVSMALYGRPGGHIYVEFLFAKISDNSLGLAVAIMLRVLALGVPVVLWLGDIDATDLGDGLAQILRLPARFVIGAMAGVRLVSLFREDWEAMALARRSRGLADVARVRRAFSMLFGLLVLSIRRGGKLATAMEARGFGRFPSRTWGRESVFVLRDYLFLGLAALMSSVSVAVSVALGAFRFLGA